MLPTPDDLALQDLLAGRFALERELGRGGMGVVWLARDLRLDRPVALKVLHPHLAADPAARKRFLREARTAAGLAHPHIVPIYAVEAIGEVACLVMAMVDGETLGARIRRRGALSPLEAERILREVAWAIGYAHSHGVIHRDLTPENVLVERETGRALLVDFGIAATVSELAGPSFGTPGYLAPEIIRGEFATERSDLYALGAVAWIAIAGTPPFHATSSAELLAKHLAQPLPSLSASARGASRRLVEAVTSCLAKDPEDRPAGVPEFLAALDRAPQAVAVAPALQEWFTRWERVRPIYAIVTPVLGLQLWLLVERYFNSGDTRLLLAAAINTIAATTLLPFIGHLASEVAALRRLSARGFGIADIRAAWSHWDDALRARHASEGLPPLAARVVFDLTAVGAVVLTGGIVIGTLILPAFVSASELYWTRGALLAYGSAVFLLTTTGLGLGFVAPGVRLRVDGWARRVLRTIWNGRVGAAVARLAAWGQSRRLAASSTLHRNTELVLGLAIDDLWRALPPASRDELGDVPRVAAALQHGAESLRTLAAQIRASGEAVGDRDPARTAQCADLEASLLHRHRDAVAALERLRLQMLRSIAASGTTVELTHELEAARAAEAEILHSIAGVAAVRELLGRPRREGPLRHSPTPTPVAT